MHTREDIPSFPTLLQYHNDKGNMVAVFEVCMRTLLGRMVGKKIPKRRSMFWRPAGKWGLATKGRVQRKETEAQDRRSSHEVLKITGKVILSYKKY